MKQLIFVFIIVCAIASCEKKKVGFLIVDQAGYDPDEMTVLWASGLDPVEDSTRIRVKFPWVSPEVQGVLGTVPYQYLIDKIYTSDGDETSFRKYTRMRIGDGSFEIPFDHQIKRGKYVIGVTIKNEGYTINKDSLFTIIVK